jgi:hypothetical protein
MFNEEKHRQAVQYINSCRLKAIRKVIDTGEVQTELPIQRNACQLLSEGCPEGGWKRPKQCEGRCQCGMHDEMVAAGSCFLCYVQEAPGTYGAGCFDIPSCSFCGKAFSPIEVDLNLPACAECVRASDQKASKAHRYDRVATHEIIVCIIAAVVVVWFIFF